MKSLILASIIAIFVIGVVGMQESFAEQQFFYEKKINDSTEKKEKYCLSEYSEHYLLAIGYDFSVGTFYKITNGSVSHIENRYNEWAIQIDACDVGFVSIDIDRYTLRSVSTDKSTCTVIDEPFLVDVDGQEVLFEELSLKENSRTLKINFENNTEKIMIKSFNDTSHKIDPLFMQSCWSPLEQAQNRYDVICKEGLERIGKPFQYYIGKTGKVCVTPNTAEKLIERGWFKL